MKTNKSVVGVILFLSAFNKIANIDKCINSPSPTFTIFRKLYNLYINSLLYQIVLLLAINPIFTGNVYGQKTVNDSLKQLLFTEIDNFARNVPKSGNPAKLAQQLTGNYTSETEKVRAIFRWITHNVRFDVKQLGKSPLKTTPADEPKLNRKMARKALRSLKTGSEGYARLFAELCTQSGIQATVIPGFGRSNPKSIGKKVKADHVWNAARIDSVWYLFDVCWASGYVDEEIITKKDKKVKVQSFIKSFNDLYFMTSPPVFILNHYPITEYYTFSPKVFTRDQFFNFPHIYPRGFSNLNIKAFMPEQGIITCNTGDSVKFWINTKNQVFDIRIIENEKKENQKVTWKNYDDYCSFKYFFGDENIKFIDIYFNNLATFRYKTEITKKIPVTKKRTIK